MKYTTQNPQKLKDYAFKYYFRYYPSNRRLLDRLTEKADWSEELAWKIFNEIKHLLQEEDIIRSKIRNYLYRNKNLNYIKQKLLIKQFPKTSVENILETEFLEKGKSLLTREFIIKKINSYKQKAKSRNYIRQKLIERSEDVSLVDSCLEEAFINWEMDSIKKEYEKLKGKYTKEQIVNKLVMKGFKYKEILRLF